MTDTAFIVRTASTGRSFEIPAGTTILEVLRDHGFDFDTSCEAGICGSCRTGYISGEPDHRDVILTAQEHSEYLTVCVSRARSKELVLDL
jgi:ferredoxin